MNKKAQKGLVSALAAVMSAGIAAPVFASAATTDLGAKYKAAYDAVQAALKSNTQKDLTAARVLVDALYVDVKGTPDEYLATTLSSILDPAQQTKLVELFAAIDKADASVKQADINAARTLILDMPQVWVNSFSSRIDTIQQKLVNNVVVAIATAQKSGLQADLDKALALLNDLLTVTNNDGIKDYANTTLKADYDKAVTFVGNVKAATDKVVAAETSRKQADVDAAKKLVDALADGTVKTDLLARLAKIVVLVDVSSVSAITSTDVTVALPAGFDATKAASVDSYEIVVNGTAVKPTAVTVSGSSAKLSISLAGQDGTLTVNGVAGNATNGTDKFDFKKPTIVSVQAQDAKTIVVNFSEKVDSSALASANYTLYNVQTGTAEKLDGSGSLGISAIAAFTDATHTAVKLTLNVPANTAGYPMQGLSNGNYMLYVSSVSDAASNTIVAMSNVTFAGTTTPSTTGASLASSTFNAGSGLVTLNFDKPVTAAAAADDKVYFQVGSNKVYLKNAKDYNSVAQVSATSISFVVDTTTTTGTTLAAINALGTNPQIGLAAGAFTDGTNATLASTSTPTIVASPVLTGVTYDENTNTAVFKFNKTIDVTSITSFSGKFLVGGVDIYDADMKFNNTTNGTDLSFTLSGAAAQAVETAVRGGNLTATVAPGAVKDTDDTPNANVSATSSATLVVGTSYTKDTTPATVAGIVYNTDTDVLAVTFNEPVRNIAGDFVGANIGIYTDTNGVAGLQTAASGSTLADTLKTNLLTLGQSDFYTDATGLTAYTGVTGTKESKTVYIKNAAITAQLHSLDFTLADVYVNFATGSVKDANTNATTAAQAQQVSKVAVSNAAAITTATTVVPDNLGSVTVTFKNAAGNVAMDPTTATNIANYNLYLTANPLAKVQIKSITMNADNTAATLLLSAPLTLGSSYSLTTNGILTAAGKAGDIAGTSTFPAKAFVAPAPEAATNLAVTGAPVLTDADKSGTVSVGDKIAITFNEAIKLPTGFDASNLTVNNNHSLGTSTVALSADAKTLTITVGSGASIAVGDTITFPLTVKNYENTPLAAANQTTTGLIVSGNVAPKLKSVVYADTNGDGIVSKGDTLVVKFNQNVKAADGSNLKDDIKIGAATFSAATLSGDTLTLTIDTPDTIAVNASIDIDTTDTTPADGVLDNVNITNVWGTQAVSNAVTISKVDEIAPTVTGFSYNSTTHELTMSLSEAVNISGGTIDVIAAAIQGKLTVAAGSLGTAGSATGATVSADGKSITIKLTGEALDQYSTITVSAGSFTNITDASLNQAVRSQATPYTLTVTQ